MIDPIEALTSYENGAQSRWNARTAQIAEMQDLFVPAFVIAQGIEQVNAMLESIRPDLLMTKPRILMLLGDVGLADADNRSNSCGSFSEQWTHLIATDTYQEPVKTQNERKSEQLTFEQIKSFAWLGGVDLYMEDLSIDQIERAKAVGLECYHIEYLLANSPLEKKSFARLACIAPELMARIIWFINEQNVNPRYTPDNYHGPQGFFMAHWLCSLLTDVSDRIQAITYPDTDQEFIN